MVKQIYPRVEINSAVSERKRGSNSQRCGEFGIDIAGVIKGTTGIPGVRQNVRRRRRKNDRFFPSGTD